MKQKWEARAQKSEKRIATYTEALETKETKTASTKRKQPSDPDVAEGSERPRKIPVIQHPSIASAEAARDEIKVCIDGLKAERSRLFLAIQQVKSELADQRYQLYIRRRALNLTGRDQKAPRQTKALQQIRGQPPIAKAEDMELMGDAVIIAKNFTFSGTDNGVVKMTESVPVSIQKYVYHLKLYNKFSALTTTEE